MPSPPEFESLVDSHYGALFRFAMSLCRNESDARDLTQQTFLIWARRGHQLNDANKAKSWLFTTMHRQFLQKRRRFDRFPETELDETTRGDLIEKPRSGVSVDADRLLRIMEHLNPVLRAPLALFYLEDYSYPEIAACLEIPLGTVKSRISRGITQLRVLMEPVSPDAPIGNLKS